MPAPGSAGSTRISLPIPCSLFDGHNEFRDIVRRFVDQGADRISVHLFDGVGLDEWF
jgi:hypothetical protein